MAAFTFAFFAQVYAYHFHAHTPFWRSNALNRLLDAVYSAVNGEPQSFYTYQHLRHHDAAVLAVDTKYNRFGPLRGALSATGVLDPLFYAQQLDFLRLYWVFALVWTRRHAAPPRPDGARARRLPPGKYSWHRLRGETLDAFAPPTSAIITPYVAEWAFLARERGYLPTVVAEIAAIVGLRLALAALAPRFFFFVYLPYATLLFAVRSYTDFVDHFGADVASKPHNSVSCYGAVFNALTFNSGYHLEHHWSPGLHWTKYPQLRPKMAPETERRVVPGHLWLNPFFAVRAPTPPAASSPASPASAPSSAPEALQARAGVFQLGQVAQILEDDVGGQAEVDEAADVGDAEGGGALDHGAARGGGAHEAGGFEIAFEPAVHGLGLERVVEGVPLGALVGRDAQVGALEEVGDHGAADELFDAVAVGAEEGVEHEGDLAAAGEAGVRAVGAVLADLLLEIVEALAEQVGEQAEAAGAGVGDGADGAGARDPQGEVGLDGAGVDLGLDGVAVGVFAGVLLAAPELLHGLERLEHAVFALGVGVGGEHEVVGAPARGDGELDAPAGDVIDDRPLFGDAHGVVQGHDDAAGAQADALGDGGEGGADDGGVGVEAAPGVEMALGDPDGRVAVGVGVLGDLERQSVRVGALGAVSDVAPEHNAKIHASVSILVGYAARRGGEPAGEGGRLPLVRAEGERLVGAGVLLIDGEVW
ncbi:MAG TPA: fatty acid desaturase [Polyangiaceae bacterium]|nr:fatty acid desaturase [Polyangiaceae bacterium]